MATPERPGSAAGCRAGIDARSRVLGPEFVTKAFSTADSFNREMQELHNGCTLDELHDTLI